MYVHVAPTVWLRFYAHVITSNILMWMPFDFIMQFKPVDSMSGSLFPLYSETGNHGHGSKKEI